MSNKYLRTKANETAEAICKKHNIKFPAALLMTRGIWEEARRCIMKTIGSYGAENWQKLPLKEKAEVCSLVVRGLLDKRKLSGFMAGDRKSIV
ncbi:MAG: hypothetical protein V3W31_10050 [Thermodesulfobacteriota bacterium]